MSSECKTCTSPKPIRELVERMRSAGISYRDAAAAVKAIRDYDISHASIQRHEVEGHYSVQAVIAENTPLKINPEELSMKTIVTRKLMLYWENGGKDEIPNSTEVRNWLKLWADIRQSETEREERQQLRDIFTRKALPAGEVIEVKVIE